MTFWDHMVTAAVKLFGKAEDLKGGPLYEIHDYCEVVPGTAGQLWASAWPDEQVLKFYRLDGITRVMSFCEERPNDPASALYPHDYVPITDGGIPTAEQFQLVRSVVRLVKATPGMALACHCEAGLRRTRTVLAAVLITEFGTGAEEALSWAERNGPLWPAEREWVRQQGGT